MQVHISKMDFLNIQVQITLSLIKKISKYAWLALLICQHYILLIHYYNDYSIFYNLFSILSFIYVRQ